MANIKSSKKDVISSKIAYEKNKANKSELKTNLKKFDAALASGDKAAAEAAEQTVAEIEALGVKCKAYAGNAADFAETEAVVAKIKEDFGTIDVLVNNAGITKDGLMLRMSEAQWDDGYTTLC